MKVYCPCAECQYNKKNKCSADELKLKWRNMATVNEGRVDMWICDKYSLDDQTRELQKQLEEYIRRKK